MHSSSLAIFAITEQRLKRYTASERQRTQTSRVSEDCSVIAGLPICKTPTFISAHAPIIGAPLTSTTWFSRGIANPNKWFLVLLQSDFFSGISLLETVPHISYHIRSIHKDLCWNNCRLPSNPSAPRVPDPNRIPNHWDFGVKGPQGEKPNVEALGKRCELLPAIVGGPSGIGRQRSRANKVGWLILVSVCSSGTRQAMHFWGKLRGARNLLSLMYRKATRLWCYLFMRGNGQSHEKMTALKLLE